MDPVTLGQAISESGPVLGALVLHAVWTHSQNKELQSRVHDLENAIDAKLNNGIKSELTNVKERLSNIEGQMASLPRRASDSTP